MPAKSFKYIIFDGSPSGLTGFDGFIFPPYVEHDAFAAKFRDWEVISAGFVEVEIDRVRLPEAKIRCSGKSVSLKIGSHEGDEAAFKWLIDGN